MLGTIRKNSAFTLIELLIVVAIIAILAAIAVPNFLEAQTRSKVSRTKSDMRTMATALEAYAVDFNQFPQCHSFGTAVDPDGGPAAGQILERLSTPVAYLTNAVLKDPFLVKGRYSAANAAALATSPFTAVSPATDAAAKLNSYIYQAWNSEQRFTNPPDGFSAVTMERQARAWLLHSVGPDSAYHNLGGVLDNDTTPDGPILLIYDPTNGTVSFGSIYRVGGNATSSGGTSSYGAGSGLVAAISKSQN